MVRSRQAQINKDFKIWFKKKYIDRDSSTIMTQLNSLYDSTIGSISNADHGSLQIQTFSRTIVTYHQKLHEEQDKDNKLLAILSFLIYAITFKVDNPKESKIRFAGLLIKLKIFDYYAQKMMQRLETSCHEQSIELSEQIMLKSIFKIYIWLEDNLLVYEKPQMQQWLTYLIPNLVNIFEQFYQRRTNPSTLPLRKNSKKFLSVQAHNERAEYEQESLQMHVQIEYEQTQNIHIYSYLYQIKDQWKQLGMRLIIAQILLENTFYFQQYLSLQDKSNFILKHYFLPKMVKKQGQTLKSFVIATQRAQEVSFITLINQHHEKTSFQIFLIKLIEYLTLQGILHKDISISNILKVNGNYKLNDFDFVLFLGYPSTNYKKELYQITKQIIEEWLQEKPIEDYAQSNVSQLPEMMFLEQDSIVHNLFFSSISSIKNRRISQIQQKLKLRFLAVKKTNENTQEKTDKCLKILKQYLPFSIIQSMQHLFYQLHKNSQQDLLRYKQGFNEIAEELLTTYDKEGMYLDQNIHTIFKNFVLKYILQQQ